MKKCFFVTPIGSDTSTERKVSDFVLKTYLNPVLEPLGYEVLRADILNTVDRIDQSVIEQLNNSELVIADLSGNNPNVMFELGYRIAIDKPTILITQDLSELPFDIQNLRTLQYETTAPDIDGFKSKLESFVKVFDNIEISSNYKNDTPSYDEQMKKAGEQLVLNSVQTGDFSAINNFMKLAEALNIPINDESQSNL